MTPIETIHKVLFYDKILNQIKQGTLILAQGSVYEVHFTDEKYSFQSMEKLLESFDFAKLPFESKRFNFLQRLIIKLFKLT